MYKERVMFHRKRLSEPIKEYDRENVKPVIKCSICNGEQVAGFKNIRTGKFEEIMLIQNEGDLRSFMQMYGIDEVVKEY